MIWAWLRSLLGNPNVGKQSRLIIGLGNPGAEYVDTRHNIGFRIADEVARKARISIDLHKWNAWSGWGSYRSRRVGVAKPDTFMNLSGEAIAKIVRKNDIDLKDVLVILDDVHLPFGTVRIRPKGGSGGHNGLESIIDEIGHGSFARLRFGIGGDFERGDQSDYVLGNFSDDEEKELAALIDAAAKAALTFVASGVSVAMNRYNSSSGGKS